MFSSLTPNANSAKKRSDIIIYGATGFTGRKIALELAKNPPSQKAFTWAIAGRSSSKLDSLLKEILEEKSPLMGKPQVIVVDVVEEELLLKTMASFTVCINCVGPFRLYGAPVVKACALGKTNYVDICGETEFIEQQFADWNEKAIENQIAIVPACGYDSVPADIGNLYAKLQFQKEEAVCTQNEMFVQFGFGPSGMVINATTFESAVLGFASVGNLRALRRKTHRKLVYGGKPLQMIKSPKWNPVASGYTVPLPAADVPVVKLGQQITQNHLEKYKEKKGFPNSKFIPSPLPPVQFAGYISMQSWIAILYLSYIGFLLYLTSNFAWLRKIVIKYPAFFTFGIFTLKGPSEQQLVEGSFTQTFVSKGYKQGELEAGSSSNPSLEIVTKITGPEMGYVTTPASVLTCALLLLGAETKSKIPYGVLTPASAFSNVVSELIDGLEKRGNVKFSLVSRRDFFKCPITLEIMNDPVIDHEGNSFERGAIIAWIQQHGDSPITRRPLRETDLTTNRALRDLIDAFKNGSPLPAPLQTLDPPVVPLCVEYDDSIQVSATQIERGGDSSNDLFYFEIKPSESSVPTRVNIVACIDISGSMSDLATIPGGETTALNILDVVKHAVKSVIKTLSALDHLAIVAFSDDATIVLPLTPMNEQGQYVAFEKLDELVPMHSTNIWAGLDKSIDLLSKETSSSADSLKNLTCILLLTDGVPNSNPPRGLVPTLKLRKEKTGLPDTICTFGFGYNLDSPLLRDIAAVGNGSYSFIPDPGFVGTIFVHSIANILTTCATSCHLELSSFTHSIHSTSVFPISATGGGAASVALGKLQIGQAKSLTLCGTMPADATVSLRVTMRNGETIQCPCNLQPLASSALDGKILDCKARMLFISKITRLFTVHETQRDEEAATFAESIKSLFTEDVPITEQASSLLVDLTGQVVEAFRQDYFEKWGRHYLPSLLYAHTHQVCNNFKDPGVQKYGGELFEKIRDIADELFCKLPAPVPKQSYNSSFFGGVGLGGGNISLQAGPPINMAAFNQAGGVCFHADSLVKMSNGLFQKASLVRRGDILANGAIVLCVIESLLSKPMHLVELDGEGCMLTPFHPIRCKKTSRWAFPIDLGATKCRDPSTSVFNFILDSFHSVQLGSFEALTLGHGVVDFDGVASHPLFGNMQKIVQQLNEMQGYPEGYVKISGVCRDPASGLVESLVGFLQPTTSQREIFTEELRSLGFPQPVSIESFRTPNFDLMAKVLFWLIKSYEPQFQTSLDFSTEANRVHFVKSVAAFLAPKAQINLNTRNLYKSDGYSVKELMKVTSLLCKAKHAPNTPDSTIGAPPLEIASKLPKLKQCRALATEITEKGSEIYDLLGQEMETKEIRAKVISQPFELADIENSVKSSVENLKKQLKETMAAFENLQADEANLVSKIDKKKQEFDRAEKRLKSLQGVRPAYMDEYERIEKDLVGIYETYMEKFRNLAYLEQQLDDYNREEQDKFVETEESLKRMQNRLREEELNLLRGEKESGSGNFRPSRPAAASSRGRLSTQVNSGDQGLSGDEDEDDEEGISLGSDEESSDGIGGADMDEDSSELIQQGIPSKTSRPEASSSKRQPQSAALDSDDDDDLGIDDDEEEDEEDSEDDNDF